MKYDVMLSGYLREKPIPGIKCLRLLFSLGLYEAKQIFDEIKITGKVMNLSDHEATVMRSEGYVVDPISSKKFKMTREVTVYIPDDGKKINAIKNLRNATGMGLKEAKDTIDLMWADNKPVTLPSWYCTDRIMGRLQTIGFTVKGFTLECFKDNEDLFEI